MTDYTVCIKTVSSKSSKVNCEEGLTFFHINCIRSPLIYLAKSYYCNCIKPFTWKFRIDIILSFIKNS